MGIDEFKKHVMKIFLEGKNRLERFLHDVADLSYIGEYTLERELKDILMTRKDEAPSKKDE